MAQDKKYAFIFDIGRVLLDFEYDKAFCKLENFSLLSAEEIKKRIFDKEEGLKLFNDYECGHISSNRFYEEVKRLANLDLIFEDFANIWSDIFTENKSIVDFLERAKEYPTAIITNTSALHWERSLANSFIKSFFNEDAIIKSYEVGVKKPDSKLYNLAKNVLPADSEIIYFEDVGEYINAASVLGIRGIKYDCRTDDINRVLEENNLRI